MLDWLSSNVTFDNIGNTTSVLSLGITIWVAISILKIKKSYLNQARVPELVKKLRTYNSELNRALNDFGSSKYNTSVQIRKISATLLSLKPKLSYTKPTKSLIRKIKKLDYEKLSEEVARNIYRETTGIIEGIDNELKDEQWKR